ncbi:serpin family protein [Hyalangium rubrum]|uniref:Serpin family protein n=1 Tax=Hyalangium rubrum TaxID=3103134 RepID=A0ABU5HD40_9BACT|nr:serpin family protein [Hyalangium sp. s54d21]MDY7231383.1 serpin family protein [Hyalangium sp. s54d21]
MPPELKEVLTWDENRLRASGEGLAVLVGAVMEGPGSERTSALEVLGRVLAWNPRRAAQRELPRGLETLLDSPEVEVRWVGARLVDASRMPEAIPKLRRGLGDADARLREACVGALREAELGPEALGEHLDSERAEEREAALELVTPQVREALRPRLLRLLRDSVAAVRYLAAERLGVEAEAPEAWAVTLEAAREGRDQDLRISALERLARFGPRAEAVPVLLELLRADPDDLVREVVAGVLEALAPLHPEVAEALVHALRDKDLSVAERAAMSLSRRGAATEAVVPRLLAALEDPAVDEFVRGAVALALARQGARAVVPVLVRLLKQPDDHFRARGDEVTGWGTEPPLKLQAVEALGVLGPLAEEAVPVLLASLRTGAVERQPADAEALERIGTAREELEALLCEVLPGAEGWSKARMLAVLSRVKPERDASLRLLVNALEHEDARVRTQARTHLWRVMGDRPESLERLEAFTRGEDATLRHAATEALRMLGRPTEGGLAWLGGQLSSANEEEQEHAITELRTLGRRAESLVDKLTGRRQRLGPRSRAAVLTVLGPLSGGRLDEARRAELASGLEDEDARVREAALWALADFTDVDAQTWQRAEARREDPEPQVREAAEAVLGKHRGARTEEVPSAEAPTAQAAQSLQRFTFALYAVLREGEGNRVFSPLSLFTLLAMVMRGARGGTEEALRRALRWPTEPERISQALQFLSAKLHLPTAQDAVPHIKEGDEGAALVSANGFWGQEGYAFRAEYLSELAEQFGVTTQRVDFAGAPTQASERINTWAREQTRGRVTNLFSPEELSEATRYVMANAVYFRSRWAQPFYEGTREAPFHLLDGREVDVPMMSREGRFGYARGSRYQLIELPYRGGQTSMVVLLPDAGFFERIERLLTAEGVEGLLAKRTQEDFTLKLPRFHFEQSVNVTELAERLGLSALFGAEADLSGMTPMREPFAGQLRHDATLTVDEEGTEAAAVMRVYHMGGVPQVVVANRPFLYLIRHEATGAVLFLGRVMDPRGSQPQGNARG